MTLCVIFSTIGFSIVGYCLFGIHFSKKAEQDFLPWKCEVKKTFVFRDDNILIDAYPLGFTKSYRMPVEDSYLRKQIFMTKTKNYTEDYMEYICYLYGYIVSDYSVEEEHTIIWDVEKMDSFFHNLFFFGIVLGLFGLFFFLNSWRIDYSGEYMHTKVKQIFLASIFATAMFITGVGGLVVDFFPYDGFAKSVSGFCLGISLCYPNYCFWAALKLVRRRPSSANQGGKINCRSGENEMGTITYGDVYKYHIGEC